MNGEDYDDIESVDLLQSSAVEESPSTTTASAINPRRTGTTSRIDPSKFHDSTSLSQQQLEQNQERWNRTKAAALENNKNHIHYYSPSHSTSDPPLQVPLLSVDASNLKRQPMSTYRYSPATQTLNSLQQSQESCDLNYDKLSQMQYDIVNALVHTKTATVDNDDYVTNSQTTLPKSQPNGHNRKRQKTGASIPNSKRGRVAPEKQQSQGSIGKRGRLPHTERRDIQQIDAQTGKVICTCKSFTEAGQVSGVARKIVANIVRGTHKSYQCKGWTFKYVDDDAGTIDSSNDVANQMEEEYEEDHSDHASDNDDEEEEEDNAITPTASTAGKKRSVQRIAKQDNRQDSTSPLQQENEFLPSSTHPARVNSKSLVQSKRPNNSNKTEKETIRTSNKAIPISEYDAVTGRLIQTYRTLTLAIESSGANWHDITAVLKGKRTKWNGLKWQYGTSTSLMDSNTSIEPTDLSQTEQTIPSKVGSAMDDDIEDSDHEKIAETGRSKQAHRKASSTSTKRTDHNVDHIAKIASTNVVVQTTSARKLRSTCIDSDDDDDKAKVHKSRANNDIASTSKQISKVDPTKGNDPTKNMDLTTSLSHQDPGTTYVPSSDEESDEYTTLRISVSETGAFGVGALKAFAPEAVLSLLNINSDRDKRKYLKVDSLSGECSIAQSYGIQAGDYLFSVVESPNPRHIGQEIYGGYDSIVELLRTDIRPITLSIVRLKPSAVSKTNASTTATPTKKNALVCEATKRVTSLSNTSIDLHDDNFADGSEVNARGVGPARVIETNVSVEKASQDGSLVESESNLKMPYSNKEPVGSALQKGNGSCKEKKLNPVPFCARCNGRKAKMQIHHCWCPKNTQFVSSGADEVLAKILRGVELDCSVCRAEYESGRRLLHEKHSILCRVGSNGDESQRINSNFDTKSKTVKPISTTQRRDNGSIALGTFQVDRSGQSQKSGGTAIENVEGKQRGISSLNLAKIDKICMPSSGEALIGNIPSAKAGTKKQKAVPQTTSITVKSSKKSIEVKKGQTSKVSSIAHSKALTLPKKPTSDDESINDFNQGEKLSVEWEDCDGDRLVIMKMTLSFFQARMLDVTMKHY
jgi:hypothetical protein